MATGMRKQTDVATMLLLALSMFLAASGYAEASTVQHPTNSAMGLGRFLSAAGKGWLLPSASVLTVSVSNPAAQLATASEQLEAAPRLLPGGSPKQGRGKHLLAMTDVVGAASAADTNSDATAQWVSTGATSAGPVASTLQLGVRRLLPGGGRGRHM